MTDNRRAALYVRTSLGAASAIRAFFLVVGSPLLRPRVECRGGQTKELEDHGLAYVFGAHRDRPRWNRS